MQVALPEILAASANGTEITAQGLNAIVQIGTKVLWHSLNISREHWIMTDKVPIIQDFTIGVPEQKMH